MVFVTGAGSGTGRAAAVDVGGTFTDVCGFDEGTGELDPRTTEQFRAMLRRRAVRGRKA